MTTQIKVCLVTSDQRRHQNFTICHQQMLDAHGRESGNLFYDNLVLATNKFQNLRVFSVSSVRVVIVYYRTTCSHSSNTFKRVPDDIFITAISIFHIVNYDYRQQSVIIALIHSHIFYKLVYSFMWRRLPHI